LNHALFLIDNFDENISEGLLKEITRAQNINKKCIYFFLNDPGRAKTSIQEKLTGARGFHYKELIDFREFIDNGYFSVINDIVKVYQQYTKEKFDLTKEVSSTIEITKEGFLTETIDIDKLLFENLGLTNNRIVGLIYEPEDKIQSSDLDESCSAILEVLLGEKKFNDVNLTALLENLSRIQSTELHEIVSKRWEAISSFYSGDLDNSIAILETLYNFSFR
jgi:hypothetical protein